MGKTTLIVGCLAVAVAVCQSAYVGNRFSYGGVSGYPQNEQGLWSLLKNSFQARSLQRYPAVSSENYFPSQTYDENTLPLDQVIVHPLFQVYIGLPYFELYWATPSFQRYVSSPLFQRYWQFPQFQQYFVNRVLFYKFVYPEVVLFRENFSYNFPYGGISQNRGYNPLISSGFPLSTGSLENGRLQETVTEVKVTPEGTVSQQTIGETVNPVTGDLKITTGDFTTVEEKIVPVEDTNSLPVVNSLPIVPVVPSGSVVVPQEPRQQQAYGVPFYGNGRPRYFGQYPYQPLEYPFGNLANVL